MRFLCCIESAEVLTLTVNRYRGLKPARALLPNTLKSGLIILMSRNVRDVLRTCCVPKIFPAIIVTVTILVLRVVVRPPADIVQKCESIGSVKPTIDANISVASFADVPGYRPYSNLSTCRYPPAKLAS